MGRSRFQARTRRLAQLGAVIVAIVSVTYLGASVALSSRTTASLTTSAAYAAQTGAYRQAVCLNKAVRQVVPKGATVFIGRNDNGYLTDQLAIELASWAPLSASPGAAKWAVSYTTDAHGASTRLSAGCDGLYIRVTKER